MRKIKVLFIQNNPGVGGGIITLYNHLSFMDMNIFNPTLLYSHENDTIFLIKNIEGVKTKKIEKTYKFQGKSHILSFVFDELPYALKLYSLCRKFKPDIIIANNDVCQHWGGIVVAKILKLPIIVTMRGGSYRCLSKVDKWLATLCDSIISMSKSIFHIYEGLPKDKCNVIYDGVNPLLFEKGRSNFRNELLNNGEGKIIIAILGRIDRFKGQDIFIKVAIQLIKKYENVIFFIVGRKMKDQLDYFDDLENKIIEAGASDNIKFAGFYGDVADVLRGIDVLVHASNIAEPFGMVVLEGMASGLPVVASKFGGPSEMIDDGENGFLFDPNDEKQLLNRLSNLIENEELRRRIGLSASKKVKTTFPIEATVNNWKSHILKVLDWKK